MAHAKAQLHGKGDTRGGSKAGGADQGTIAELRKLKEEVKQLRANARNPQAAAGGEAAAGVPETAKPAVPLGGAQRTPEQEAAVKRRTELQEDMGRWIKALEGLKEDRDPELWADLRGRIDKGKKECLDIKVKLDEARVAAQAEARDRKPLKAQLDDVENKLSRARKKKEDELKKLESQREQLAKLQEQVGLAEAKVQQHSEDVKTLSAEKARLHSEIAASSAADAGSGDPSDEEAIQTKGYGAVMQMLPQVASLGSKQADDLTATLVETCSRLAAVFLQQQSPMEVDDRTGDMQTSDPLASLGPGPNRDVLRLGRLFLDKQKAEEAERAEEAAPNATDGDAAGTATRQAGEPPQAEGGGAARSEGAQLQPARDSGKVQELLASGQANRAGAAPYKR